MSVVFTLILIAVIAVLVLYLRTQSLARQAEASIPMAGKLLSVPGGAIHYVEMGDPNAPPLVLIHGISAQLQHFTYAMADLLAADFRVVVLDRPGCGYSTRDSEDLAGLPSQARMIGAFMDALDLENPVVVGHSLGGAVTLALALDRPEKIGAIALLCPATHEQPDPPDMFKGLDIKSVFMRRVLSNTIAVPMAKATTEKVLEVAFSPEPAPDDFLLRAAGGLGLRPKSFVTASGDFVAVATDIPAQQARYGDLKVPGGVLFGASDALLSPAVHGRPMEQFGLSYEDLPDRGHMIPITAPADCADFVRRMAAKSAG